MQLARSREHRWIAGVCGGIAERLGWSPLAVRVLYVVIPFLGIPTYIVLWWLMPEADPVESRDGPAARRAAAPAVGRGRGARAAPPSSVSDRQGFNKRWYAGDEGLRIFRPTSGSDVVAAFAAVLEDPTIEPDQLQITCGRHCYEGFVYNARTRTVIDMTGLKSFGEETVDSEPTLYVEVGLGNWDMYRLLNNVYQKTLPAGSCYSVGLGGHITGGGYGVLSRLYGLTIDYLTAVDIVVGERGRGARMIRQCSATNEPELFWAVRGGGGGQFGIITRYYFSLDRLPAAPAYIYVHSFAWDWMVHDTDKLAISEEAFRRILAHFESFYADQSPAMWNTFGIFHATHMDTGSLGIAAIDVFDPPTHGDHADFESELRRRYKRDQEAASALGKLSTADRVLHGHPYVASTRALGITPEDTYRRYTFLEGVQQLNASGPNRYGKYKSAYHTRGFSPEMAAAAYDGLTTKVFERNGDRVTMDASLIQFDAYGGKINTVSPHATAIPQRSSIMKLQYQSYWDTSLPPGENDESLQAAHLGWINGLYEKIYRDSKGTPSGPGTEGCYYNYPDIHIGSTEPGTPPVEQALELYFGGNLGRLTKVCASYNPERWFLSSQSIGNVV